MLTLTRTRECSLIRTLARRGHELAHEGALRTPKRTKQSITRSRRRMTTRARTYSQANSCADTEARTRSHMHNRVAQHAHKHNYITRTRTHAHTQTRTHTRARTRTAVITHAHTHSHGRARNPVTHATARAHARTTYIALCARRAGERVRIQNYHEGILSDVGAKRRLGRTRHADPCLMRNRSRNSMDGS